jgi:hypothetical protein
VGQSRGPEEAFILAANLSLVGALGWVALEPGVLDGHFYRNPVFGLTHILTLGWVSLMILGVLLRLSPVALGVEPRGKRLGFAVWGLWVVGASGVVAHMIRGEWFGVWTSAVCVFASAVLLPVLHPGILRRAREGNAVARYAALAMLNLILAASAGLFIGINKHLGLVALDPTAVLGIHFHLAEIGWVSFMILGFGRKLLPSLAPPAARDPGETRRRLLALEVGLLCVVAGLLGVPGLLFAGTILLGFGILDHLGRPLLRLARGRVEDRASFWASIALLFLAVDVLLGMLLGLDLEAVLPWPRDRLLFAYGVIALLGWNTLAITSIAMKLFPLWVWKERFEEDWGKRPVPAVKDLYCRYVQEATGAALGAGCLVTVAGILQAEPAVVAWGVRLAALGSLCFLFNFVRMSRWAILPLEFRPGPRDWERFHALCGEGKDAFPGT